MLDPTVFDPQNFDIGIILTAAGVPIASAIIAAVIQMMKRIPGIGPILDAGREAFLALILSAALTGYAYTAIGVAVNPTTIFLGFLAFLNIAGMATKVYDIAPQNVKDALGG